jgi:DGQHR domain-containing protein
VKLKSSPLQTIKLYALRGQFDGVTYFMTTMTLADVSEQLHFEDVQAVKSFRERVQRALDRTRAEQIFENYLKKHTMRFFNSLVAVIMPPISIKHGYFEFESFEADTGKIDNVGMLSIRTDIQRIVVDGQHRLYALNKANEYTRDPSYESSLMLREVRVPVLFLTFDDVGGEGFSVPVSDVYKKVSDRARKVFVDLNRNAKKADKNTLFILDDEDFSAVAARDLIEKQPELEKYTKWHGRGTTLADTDVFFTTIELLNHFVDKVVDDEDGKISNRYQLPVDEERERALAEHLDSPSAELYGLQPRKMINEFYSGLQLFPEWTLTVKRLLGGEPELQPKETTLSRDQKRDIKAAREVSLLLTVVGQRVAIDALIEAFPHMGKTTAEENYSEALRRLNMIERKKLYNRDESLWLELLTRPGNKMKLTAKEQATRLLSDLLQGNPASHVQEYITPSIEEGIGTEQTVELYEQALAKIGKY